MTTTTSNPQKKQNGFSLMDFIFQMPMVAGVLGLALVSLLVAFLPYAGPSVAQFRTALAVGSFLPKTEYVAVMYEHIPYYSGNHVCTFTIDQKNRTESRPGYSFVVTAEDGYPFPAGCISLTDKQIQYCWDLDMLGGEYSNSIMSFDGCLLVGPISKTKEGLYQVTSNSGATSIVFAPRNSAAGKALLTSSGSG